ncbi:MAG: imidazole glycerol phosphate synthase subunit HisH [Proteobacteria bacterium]|nr:imidazole glycerol phosphate synthase subunit HisH [Pseudomonadota bacterium]
MVIVDNGGGNVASVRYALERLGCRAQVSADPAVVAGAARVVLPGVGAAREAMRRLAAAGLDRLLPSLTQPVLGICLGMQLLAAASDEGATECLGILPGRAERLPGGPERPVPHMGWNQLEAPAATPLLAGLRPGDYAYFVHSYALPVGPATIATCHYGLPFSAAVSHRNFHGAQFHPERSGAVGARLLANFLALAGPAWS